MWLSGVGGKCTQGSSETLNCTFNTDINQLSRTHTHTLLNRYICIHTCMDLHAAAVAVDKRGGAIFLQQRVRGSWRAVLFPEGKADLWDQGLGSFQTTIGMCGAVLRR